MLIFTKFIALTSAFSLVGGLLIDLCWILIARMGVIVGVIYSLRGWLLLCSLVWLASFFLSWRILITPLLMRTAE